MPGISVAISKVSDGSMYNRNDPKDPQVIKNREVFLKNSGITLEQTTRMRVNIHARDKIEHDDNFCRYREVSASEKGSGMHDDKPEIDDALVTTDTNHAMLLPVADCVGTVMYDPVKRVLMVSHLGRQSLTQGGGKKSVEFLVEKYGCNPANLLVWMTPAPGKDVYPIWALDNKGMKEVTFEQLFAAGIHPDNITDNPIETDKDPNYFSYSEFLKGNRTEDGDIMIVAMMTD